MADTKSTGSPTADAPTRSLRASANPQARMQELLRRDAPDPAPAIDTTTLPDIGTTELPDSSATSSAVAQIDSSAVAQPDSSEDAEQHGSAVAKKRRDPVAQRPSSAIAQKAASVIEGDPVRQAMLGMLALPYPADMAEGAMTVTSVKIPRPVWERLEYARTLTKKDKQDIIADALRIYFELIVEGGLDK